ncbi:DUF3696 domain-containing protein [Bacteroides acidifaciens]|uniref:DUF3696 domain-containing protein n=1 Tax=Bacteroides acidifaciens TaxID=85831 RepID=UPI0025B3BAA8|nr:DUF3696 domain-containing protein [Bacteroides acidifaciens]
MITKLIIKNFKSHLNSEIEVRNLTVLTGINGCGKTSLIQALLLLRQTNTKGRLRDGLDLNIPLCKIGIGNDALCQYASEGKIEFTLNTEESGVLSFCFDADVKTLKDSFLKKMIYSENVNPENIEELSLFNNNFQYISADRWGGRSDFPKETYAAETQRQLSIEGGKGELVAQFLHAFGGEVVTVVPQLDPDMDMSLMGQVIYWERKISPNVTLNVEQNKDGKSFAITYGYSTSGDDKPLDNLRAENIGYGISYTLPVIVALLSAKPGSLIIIENPEAHLHPAGQSELAKLITLVASNGVQVIIETHSDHIVSGIQLACKAYEKDHTTGISRDDVALYYFSNDSSNRLHIDPIKIEETGALEHQPKGFFDQAEKDMFQLYRGE